MRLRCLNADDLDRALPVGLLMSAMREAFVALANGRAAAPPRAVIESPGRRGTTLVMGARVGEGSLASKTVSIFPENAARSRATVNALVTVLDPATGEPVGLLDGTRLTALRTAAVVAAVSDVLLPEAVDTAALIGCGAQAAALLRALDSIREFDTIRVCGRERRRLVAFVARHQPHCRARLEATRSPRVAVSGARLVTAATNSREPVLDGADLAPGVHVNGVGSFTPRMRELDRETLRGAAILVDERGAALAEAGELLDAIEQGLTRPGDWLEIGSLFDDPEGLRPEAGRRTVFKSVGHAVQDARAASLALDTARDLGLGKEIDL